MTNRSELSGRPCWRPSVDERAPHSVGCADPSEQVVGDDGLPDGDDEDDPAGECDAVDREQPAATGTWLAIDMVATAAALSVMVASIVGKIPIRLLTTGELDPACPAVHQHDPVDQSAGAELESGPGTSRRQVGQRGTHPCRVPHVAG
jgi:hypothetical protein